MHGHDFCIYRRGTLTRHGCNIFGSCSFFIILMLIKNTILNISETYRNFGVSEFRTIPDFGRNPKPTPKPELAFAQRAKPVFCSLIFSTKDKGNKERSQLHFAFPLHCCNSVDRRASSRDVPPRAQQTRSSKCPASACAQRSRRFLYTPTSTL